MAEELPHGWTLEDLAKIAGIVVRIAYGRLLDVEEARDVAACAIVERLYAEPEPMIEDLYRAGRRAVASAYGQQKSFVGIETNRSRSGREGVGREFARYWYSQGALVSPFEDAIVDRLAVKQVWDALSPRHQETLLALAEHGSHAAARAALGVTTKAWEHRLRKARIQARVFWYWPEAPGRQWGGTDRPGMDTDARGRNKGMTHLARQRWASSRSDAA
ncbi:MAG: hypothetical protein JWO67_2692 [Streptosporangiaceae bacterium]|nr:hypothetical protein [Streptosporangiaceae bacterium]